MNKQQTWDKINNTVSKWKTGTVSYGDMGYKLKYSTLRNLAFLYINGVDAKNPDLFASGSKNTFITDFLADYQTVCEQTRTDLKEITFIVKAQLELAEFIVMAANRKQLTIDNDWTEIQEQITDSAVWFGDSFKKIYEDKNGVMKKKALTVFDLAWDLTNFETSVKVEIFKKQLWEIVENPRYDKTAIAEFKEKYEYTEETKNESVQIYQAILNNRLYITDSIHGIIFLDAIKPKNMGYIRYTAELRQGLPMAPGKGMFEKIVNVIIQNKKAREWIYDIEEITSKLLFAKIQDKKNDKLVNKQYQKIKTGTFIPISGVENIPRPIELGGHSQLAELKNKVVSGINMYGKILKTPDVLSGSANSIGSNSSGRAIQSLAEYASSVHKDVKKRFNRVMEREYREYDLQYILKTFKKTDNIKSFLSPVEWGTVKRNILNYELAKKQAELAIDGMEPEKIQEELINYEKKIKKDSEKKNIISEEILQKLREDVKGIQIIASGEKTHPTVDREFAMRIRAEYNQNPQQFLSNGNIVLLKSEAKKHGINELEISELIAQITQE